MNAQMTIQRVCALGGVLCVVLFVLGLLIAGFLPPMAPALTADQVAQHYEQHATTIRLGAALVFVASMLNAQLAAGSFACVTFLLPAVLFAVTAF